mgnify:FL=1
MKNNKKIKYHVKRIEKVLDNMAHINLNEISMKLDNTLTNDLHLAIVEDRSKGMEECIIEVQHLKELV